MDYDKGLDLLREYARNTDWYLDFAVQESALRDNLRDERRFGASPQTRQDRARIVDQLNTLAVERLGVTFNDLCLGRATPPPARKPGQSPVPAASLRILFLAANPSNTDALRLEEEARAIDQRLRLSEHRDRFEVMQHWAVRADDLSELFLRYHPGIVHFAGHGSNSGAIVLQDAGGSAAPVPPTALAQLFHTLKDNIRLVVLNACFSLQQAKAIAKKIDFVVGMTHEIDDAAAIKFAGGLYLGLGYGRSMRTAFGLACTEIGLAGLPEDAKPKLLVKPGANADQALIAV